MTNDPKNLPADPIDRSRSYAARAANILKNLDSRKKDVSVLELVHDAHSLLRGALLLLTDHLAINGKFGLKNDEFDSHNLPYQ